MFPENDDSFFSTYNSSVDTRIHERELIDFLANEKTESSEPISSSILLANK